MKQPADLCGRCHHPADWHRHDDEACIRHPQPCVPSTAPFRCLGYDCDAAGFRAGTPESRCGCPDFVAAADARLQQLRAYVQHKPSCESQKIRVYRAGLEACVNDEGELSTRRTRTLIDGPSDICTCGLQALLDAAGETP